MPSHKATVELTEKIHVSGVQSIADRLRVSYRNISDCDLLVYIAFRLNYQSSTTVCLMFGRVKAILRSQVASKKYRRLPC